MIGIRINAGNMAASVLMVGSGQIGPHCSIAGKKISFVGILFDAQSVLSVVYF